MLAVLDASRVRRLGRDWPPTWEDGDTIGDHRTAITQVSITQSIRDFEHACRAGNIKHRVVAESGDVFTRLVELRVTTTSWCSACAACSNTTLSQEIRALLDGVPRHHMFPGPETS